jgi:hypothetical protein
LHLTQTVTAGVFNPSLISANADLLAGRLVQNIHVSRARRVASSVVAAMVLVVVSVMAATVTWNALHAPPPEQPMTAQPARQ